MGAAQEPVDARTLPAELAEGTWIHAEDPIGPGDLAGTHTLVVRWRAGDVHATAALLRAQAVGRQHGVPVLAIHVPGHPHERGPDAVADAVLREEVTAPVRQDPRGHLGARLGLARDGEVAVVDADGRIERTLGPTTLGGLGAHLPSTSGSGAGPDRAVGGRGRAPPPTELLYPQGLVLAGDRLWIADTVHHRLLEATRDGRIERIVGAGRPGSRDGPPDRARLCRPRGLALAEEGILVADSGSGAVRRVDARSGEVSTLADAKALTAALPPARGRGPVPWDLAPVPDAWGAGGVLVTLAGADGIVHLPPDGGPPSALALPDRALVQPTGIAVLGGRAYVADAARGALRSVGPDGGLRTVAGGAGDPLEHPVAVAAAGTSALALADPYGAGLVHVDLEEGRATPVPSAEPTGGMVEPRSVAADAGELWTVGADQGLRVVATADGRHRIVELEPLALDVDRSLTLDPVEVAPGGRLSLDLVAHGVGEGGWEADDPRIRGPLAPRRTTGTSLEADDLSVQVSGSVEASGPIEVRWSLASGNASHVAGWRFPVLQRPGAALDVELQLSAAPTR